MAEDKKFEGLFNEFPPVTTTEWEQKIEKDLKGADYEKKLVWKTNEGFSLRPYYREDNLADLKHQDTLPGAFPFYRSNKIKSNDWHIRQDIYVDDIEKANRKALNVLMKGVTSLGFIIDAKFEPTEENLEKLCANIYADAVELNFICLQNSYNVLQHIEKLVKKYNRQLDQIFGSVDFDPLGQYSLKGAFKKSAEASFDQAKEMIDVAKHLPNFKVITVNAKHFHNSGSTLVQELAFGLAQGVNYLTQLTERGLSIDEVAPRIKFQFAVGSNYFMEIAKFRAARMLWAQIVKAYGPSSLDISKMYIHAETSRWNKAFYDAHVNLLRTTTESMSAIIAGIDSLTVLPYNEVFEQPSEFSERIARNQQLLLKEESYFDKVVDPAAGSYYIENLTNSIAENAWNLFLEIQEKGGYLEAFKAGFIQDQISQSAQKRDMEIATRRQVILGTNQYPNTTEEKDCKFNDEIFKNEAQTASDVLQSYRGAQAFEKLRYATDCYASKNDRPGVFLVTMGNLAMRRAQFAGNFFGCAGYNIIDNNGFKSVEAAAEAFTRSKAKIAVICSSDDEYAELAPKLSELLKDEAILVVAGYPKEILDDLKANGIEHFIHMRSNVLETLQNFQQLLGIK